MAVDIESGSGAEAGKAVHPRRLSLINLLIAAATGLMTVLCMIASLPLWAVLLATVIFFSNGFRLRDGAVTLVCLAIGTLLGAGTGLTIQFLTPHLVEATLPLVIFALTFLVLSLQFVPVFNNMQAYYLGLIQFVASGQPPTASSILMFVGCGVLGGALAIVSFHLQRYMVARVASELDSTAGSEEARQASI